MIDSQRHEYDVIVIGSGPGGLTAAVALAQAGRKVLVCEQHEVPGGWTHSFTLQGCRFSPGVHCLGDLQPGGGCHYVKTLWATCQLSHMGVTYPSASRTTLVWAPTLARNNN